MQKTTAMLVKQARLLAGYSRAELARAARVSPSTVGRIESGDVDPTWAVLSAILAAAGYRVGDSLTSLGDPDAVDAAVNALGRKPNKSDDAWSMRWMRAGLLDDDGRAKNLSRLAGAAGLASDPRTRPGARAFLLDRDPARLLEDLERVGAAPFATGPIAFGDIDPMGLTAYVRDPSALSLAPAEPFQPVFIALPAPNNLTVHVSEAGLPIVSLERALVDSFASGGRVADRAEAYVSRLAAA